MTINENQWRTVRADGLPKEFTCDWGINIHGDIRRKNKEARSPEFFYTKENIGPTCVRFTKNGTNTLRIRIRNILQHTWPEIYGNQ